ncbi:MAG: hypothetical protein NTX72_01180 [Candidatus Uhrbacteria bacterium]|nr:hypothetical protein [Candidatus Uhrbacteria bacterium]
MNWIKKNLCWATWIAMYAAFLFTYIVPVVGFALQIMICVACFALEKVWIDHSVQDPLSFFRRCPMFSAAFPSFFIGIVEVKFHTPGLLTRMLFLLFCLWVDKKALSQKAA